MVGGLVAAAAPAVADEAVAPTPVPVQATVNSARPTATSPLTPNEAASKSSPVNRSSPVLVWSVYCAANFHLSVSDDAMLKVDSV